MAQQQTDLVAYHRRQMAAHADDPATGRCAAGCGRGYCPVYAEAAALLADAGELRDVDAVEVRAL